AGNASARLCHLAQRAKLRLGFDVEGKDAAVERKGHLLASLADTREHNLLRRNAHGERATKLAFGHDIHACTLPRERGEHAEIGIGLDREADERVGRAGNGVGEHPVVALESRRRIAIEGSPYCVGKIGKVDLFGVEHIGLRHASPVGEMVHGERVSLLDLGWVYRGVPPSTYLSENPPVFSYQAMSSSHSVPSETRWSGANSGANYFSTRRKISSACLAASLSSPPSRWL